MIDQYKILSQYIKNCTCDESFKYEDFNKEKVIKVHLSSGATLRKELVMNKIENLISKHNLNLKIKVDNTMRFNDRFIIYE